MEAVSGGTIIALVFLISIQDLLYIKPLTIVFDLDQQAFFAAKDTKLYRPVWIFLVSVAKGVRERFT